MVKILYSRVGRPTSHSNVPERVNQAKPLDVCYPLDRSRMPEIKCLSTPFLERKSLLLCQLMGRPDASAKSESHYEIPRAECRLASAKKIRSSEVRDRISIPGELSKTI